VDTSNSPRDCRIVMCTCSAKVSFRLSGNCPSRHDRHEARPLASPDRDQRHQVRRRLRRDARRASCWPDLLCRYANATGVGVVRQSGNAGTGVGQWRVHIARCNEGRVPKSLRAVRGATGRRSMAAMFRSAARMTKPSPATVKVLREAKCWGELIERDAAAGYLCA
jgi:hypothetical protein